MRWVRVWMPLVAFALATMACDDGSSGGDMDVSADGSADARAETGVAPNVEVPDARVPDAGVPACSDDLDNDGDGVTDLDDPGCDGDPNRDDEQEPPGPPACDDDLDNDADGRIDFPDDPGCGSAVDGDEFNEEPLPACNDALDNDNDGLIDELDPGCTSSADPNEQDAGVRACSDRIDNDGDGIIDFPLEPGCSTAGDNDETNSPVPPACLNGRDDDGDGVVDFPDEPGCAGAGDDSEEDKARKPDCSDGSDNDRDGRTDYPEDDGCIAASDFSERGSCGDIYDPPRLVDGEMIIIDTSRGVFEAQGSCGGNGSPELVVFYRLDRRVEGLIISTDADATDVPTTIYVRREDCLEETAEIACQRESADVRRSGQRLTIEVPPPGDYYIYIDGVAGAGGPVGVTIEEIALAQCLNGVDDDEDGRIDYPFDPGCDLPDDRDETSEGPPPVCSNDEDDDDDGAVDYPLDVGCLSAAGDSEEDLCAGGATVREYFYGQDFVLGDTAEQGESNSGGSCGGRDLPEVVFRYRNPVNARIAFNTAHEETDSNTVVYVRRDCAIADTELACDEGGGGTNRGRAVVQHASPGTYFVFVDTRFGQGGPFKLSVETTRLDPGCVDGVDNDGDGLVDLLDPGCTGADDEDEGDDPGGEPTACNNGEDDDHDGQPDFPYDPGCAAVGDLDETDPVTPTMCSNGIDDDEDEKIDFPFDPGCQGAGDDTENDPRPRPQCGNRVDDDRDNLIDFPLDPGCEYAADDSERDN